MVVYLNKNLFKPAVVFLSALVVLTVAYVTLVCLAYASAQSRNIT